MWSMPGATCFLFLCCLLFQGIVSSWLRVLCFSEVFIRMVLAGGSGKKDTFFRISFFISYAVHLLPAPNFISLFSTFSEPATVHCSFSVVGVLGLPKWFSRIMYGYLKRMGVGAFLTLICIWPSLCFEKAEYLCYADITNTNAYIQ